jgi:DNA-directed RNA polymerase subunit RPC12/RpoP
MASASKKLERKMSKNKKRQAEKDLKQKMGMFDKLPDECLTCSKKFDKRSKDDVQSWFVAVRKEQNKVNLYCPECWNKAQEIIKEFGENFNERKN